MAHKAIGPDMVIGVFLTDLSFVSLMVVEWWDSMGAIILLRVKPKLPGMKTGSRRFLDVTGGMDSGFSSCAAPAFYRSPGISKIGGYMRILRVTGKLQGRRMRRESFQWCTKLNNRVERVE